MSHDDQHPTDEKQHENGGKQVSEVASMDPAAADTPISDDQAVAGYPDSESGSPDEGAAGPNAIPDENARDVEAGE